jgi:hypothetical protein
MEECKVVLGWLINTRSLLISLPTDKHVKWSFQINTRSTSKRVQMKQLEVLIGRLNNLGSIIPMLRHFLSRLWGALSRSSKSVWTCLSLFEKSDLHFMQKFLDKCKEGISINNIIYRKPTHIYRSDASEFGIGGYKLISGQAWHFKIPFDCRLWALLNSLEFIICLITIWIDIMKDNIPPESCNLSQMDSTSAAGWLRKSNFADNEEMAIQLTTARHLAELMINHDCCLYSQWFKGDFNTVSDCLSRDFHLNDSSLSLLINSCVPHQVPFGFNLCSLPNEISSWLTCLLLNQPFKELWCKEPTRSKLSRGEDTNYTYCPLEFEGIPSSIPSQEDRNTKYSAPLLQLSDKVDILIQGLLKSQVTQSDPPWIAFHRPLSWLRSQTQDLTLTAKLHSFYNVNYDVTRH